MSMICFLLRTTSDELESYLKDSSLLITKIESSSTTQDSNLVDIEKSWDGINCLLTGSIVGGSEHPLEKVLFSMQYVDVNQDLGYGPANYVTSIQVKAINEEISKITDEQLKSRFDSKLMEELEIYPNDWENPDIINYLIDNFKIIQQFYDDAAKNDQVVITFLS